MFLLYLLPYGTFSHHDNIHNNTIFYLRLDAAASSSSFGSVSFFFSFVLSFPSLSSSLVSVFFPENITKYHEEEEEEEKTTFNLLFTCQSHNLHTTFTNSQIILFIFCLKLHVWQKIIDAIYLPIIFATGITKNHNFSYPLRLLDTHASKIAKICNFWTFRLLINLIKHLFKIRQKAFLSDFEKLLY